MQTLKAMQVVKGEIGKNNDFFLFYVRADDFEVEEQFPLNDDVKKTAQRLRQLARMLEQGPRNANYTFDRKQTEGEPEQIFTELQQPLSDDKTLSGLIRICASCKKIRDDNGDWNQSESYIIDHSKAKFSHGICPDCMKKLYPDIYKNLGYPFD